MSLQEPKNMRELRLLIEFHMNECGNDDCSYYKVLLENLWKELDVDSFLSEKTLDFSIQDAIQDELWLSLGITSLYAFIQSNWTGPGLDAQVIPRLSEKKEEAHQKLFLEDQCNESTKHLELLYLAKTIFSNKKLQEICVTSLWWLFRANVIHQRVLDEDSSILLEETEKIIDKIDQSEIWNYEQIDCLKTLFNVEVSQFWLLYRRVQNVKKYVENAEKSAKLTLELKGAMGKRTKYQIDEKAQLFLNIKTEKENYDFIPCLDVPISLNLDDDLRLDKIKFSEDIQIPKVGTIEETIVLTKCMFLQMSQPKDKLADEEIIPYLNYIINSSKNWPLKMEAMRRRCLLEMRDKRSIERALSQSENLLGQYNESRPSVTHRTYQIFGAGMKPIWYFKEILADVMLSLGLVKGALNHYIELSQWEQVIVCYTLLDMRYKAAEVIRQELEKKETVKLWCLLGDAEQNTDHYETAWELSKCKSSRVQRHWGLYYFAKQKYTEAIIHLRLSAELNNIQENVWIRLGFAALQVEDWRLAANAYRHYCALEQTNFEAWNNLAKAYIKLGDKMRAWRSLHDAVKCNYDKWEVWDNLMVVSTDLGYFSDVIKCYNRILDIKGQQHIDLQILEIITVKNLQNSEFRGPEGNIEDSNIMMKKSLELFGRLTALGHNEPDIWRYYAELTMMGKSDISTQKAVQYLQRAYRTLVADPRWSENLVALKKVLELSAYLADTYLSCSSTATTSQKQSMLGSAKLSLQSVIAQVKQGDLISDEDISGQLKVLEDKLDIVVDNLKRIQE